MGKVYPRRTILSNRANKPPRRVDIKFTDPLERSPLLSRVAPRKLSNKLPIKPAIPKINIRYIIEMSLAAKTKTKKEINIPESKDIIRPKIVIPPSFPGRTSLKFVIITGFLFDKIPISEARVSARAEDIAPKNKKSKPTIAEKKGTKPLDITLSKFLVSSILSESFKEVLSSVAA